MAVTNPTRSRWGFSTPSKRAIEYDVKEANKQQLLAQAQSLVPDSNKLSEMLMENEMHYADMAEAKQYLDSITATYMENYNRNPFYSFSREARNLTQAMFRAAKNPVYKQMAQQYEYDKKRWEKMRDDGLAEDYDVNQEGVLVSTPVRDEKGSIVDFRVSRKRQMGAEDTPLTLNQSFQYINQRLGSKAGGFNYEMSTDERLLNNLDKAFSGLEETRIKQDYIDKGYELLNTSNRNQLNSRINWFLNQGITQADLNNLYSKYFKQTGDFNMDNAKKYAIKYVADYAAGKEHTVVESEYFTEVRKHLNGLTGGREKEVEPPVTYTTAFQGAGVVQPLEIKTSRGSILSIEGHVVSGILDQAEKGFTKDGVTYTDRRIKKLPVLNQIISSGAYVVNLQNNKDANLRDGEFAPVPGSIFENLVVSDRADKAPKMIEVTVDQTGRPASVDEQQELGAILASEGRVIPQHLRKYIRFATDKDVADKIADYVGQPLERRRRFQHVTGLVPERRGGITGIVKSKDAEAANTLREYGYTSIDDDNLREDYYKGSGEKIELSSTLLNDRVYQIDLFIPVDKVEPYMQDKARMTSDGLLLGNTTRMIDPSRPVSRAHIGLEPFNQVKNTGNYKKYPK
jgi:hypothetical protein